MPFKSEKVNSAAAGSSSSSLLSYFPGSLLDSLLGSLLSSPSSSSSESGGERGKSELDLCGCSKRILEHHKKENNLACHVNRLHNNSLEQLSQNAPRFCWSYKTRIRPQEELGMY